MRRSIDGIGRPPLRRNGDARSITPAVMDRDEILALFARRAAAWQAHDARALALTHAENGTVIGPTGGVLEGRVVQIGVLRAKPA